MNQEIGGSVNQKKVMKDSQPFSLQNMAELHEATLQSQSVQSYSNIISKAWNQLSYLQHLKTLNQCTDQIIPCNLQTVYPLMSDIISFRAQDQRNPNSMRGNDGHVMVNIHTLLLVHHDRP